MKAPELPGADFKALAGALETYCRRAAAGLEASEILVARCDPKAAGLQRSLTELQRDVALAADVYRLFRDLVPFEAEVRAFLQSLQARRMPAGRAA